ncbi:MAG: hypothetical protein CFH38_00072 [Alphaproteobacteria bacterium MarineAlpha10_Bin1]|nr:MAG: hypothetical protein CFH38_00072 [Alphaproteobacteria bacterium MarineAlpha10_Bin1]
MDWYQIWCDLKPGEDDLTFCKSVDAYLGHLRGAGLIEEHRMMRRKFGLAHDGATEFHIMIGTKDLAQLDAAFTRVSTRDDEIENLHRAVYGAVTNLKFGLYRDFPDPWRKGS